MAKVLKLVLVWIFRIVGVDLALASTLSAVITGAVVVLLPVVLYNVFKHFSDDMLMWVLSKVSSTLPETSYVLELTGLTGWFANHLQLPGAISLLLSAALMRFTLNIITKSAWGF